MSASKTYATNRELGLKANGVVEQYRNKGSIPASANGSPHHIVNDGGSIRPHRDQVGWRIRCDEVGTDGGYEFSIGPSTTHTVMSGELEAFNVTFDVPLQLRVEHIGMVSGFGAIVATRLF